MKKYLSKALLYKEWKAVYWILAPLILFSSKAVGISNLIENKKLNGSSFAFTDGGYYTFFSISISSLITIILIVLIAYLIMNLDRKDNVSSLVNYMPFNINQRITAKLIVGLFTIFLSCFAGFVINMIMYESNIDYLNHVIKIKYITAWFIISFLLYSVIYITLVYIQCFCKNGIFGIILGCSVLTLPASIENLLIYFGFSRSKVVYNLNILIIQSYLRLGQKYKIVDKKLYVTGDRFLSSSIQLLIIAMVMCVLLFLIIRKIKVGEDVMFKASAKKEKAFKIFASVSMGIFAAKGISSLLGTSQALSIYIIILNLIFIIVTYFAYSNIDKIIKLSKYERGE